MCLIGLVMFGAERLTTESTAQSYSDFGDRKRKKQESEVGGCEPCVRRRQIDYLLTD